MSFFKNTVAKLESVDELLERQEREREAARELQVDKKERGQLQVFRGNAAIAAAEAALVKLA